MNNYEEFLQSFFNNEIYFLSSESLQRKAWGNATGEESFSTFLIRFFESWFTILEYKKSFNLSLSRFNEIQKLFYMLENFQKTIEYPAKPNEYLALLNHPDWKNIQKHANNLYTLMR